MAGAEGRGRGFFLQRMESGYSTDLRDEEHGSGSSPAPRPPIGGRGSFMQMVKQVSVRAVRIKFARMAAIVASMLVRRFAPWSSWLCCCCCCNCTVRIDFNGIEVWQYSLESMSGKINWNRNSFRSLMCSAEFVRIR